MENLLNYIAVILVIIWGIGFIQCDIEGYIHLLLVIPVVAVLLRIFGGRRAI